MTKSRVLVIEDDTAIRALIETSLRSADYAVLGAADGATGLEKARESKPDLILVDLMMPRMDGWQVVSALRAIPQFAFTPIILLTALNDPDHRLAGFRLGVDDYISKPFRAVELQIRVGRALRNRAQHAYFAQGLRRAQDADSALEIEPIDSLPPPA